MSKPVTISVPHKLGATVAKSRIESGFQRFSQSLGFGIDVDRKWNDYKLEFDARVLGQTISGVIDVRETVIVITVELPALLAGMADSIKKKLTEESTKLLEKD